MTKAKQEVFINNPEAARESRCFFCYGTFEDNEIVVYIDDIKIYHSLCIKDMLCANEIEFLQIKNLDNKMERIEGFKFTNPYPQKLTH